MLELINVGFYTIVSVLNGFIVTVSNQTECLFFLFHFFCTDSPVHETAASCVLLVLPTRICLHGSVYISVVCMYLLSLLTTLYMFRSALYCLIRKVPRQLVNWLLRQRRKASSFTCRWTLSQQTSLTKMPTLVKLPNTTVTMCYSNRLGQLLQSNGWLGLDCGPNSISNFAVAISEYKSLYGMGQ